jgi:hypothetical protein
MYNLILDELKKRIPLSTDEDLALYLQSLQPCAKNLWTSYRSTIVNFNYALEENQVAYLLRYFPHYTLPVAYSFYENRNKGLMKICETSNQDIQLFGAGACPEIIGYLKFLAKCFPEKKYNLNIKAYDIATTTWKFGRDINYDAIIPHYLKSSTINSFNSEELDMTIPFQIDIDKQKSQIIIFQNCFNEIPVNRYRQVTENVKNLFISLPPNSVLLLIDLANYSNAMNLLGNIKSEISLQKGSLGTSSIIEKINRESSYYSNLPQIIKDNLLTREHGLIPKKSIDFSYVMFTKIK